jgi:hypothetical protein
MAAICLIELFHKIYGIRRTLNAGVMLGVIGDAIRLQTGTVTVTEEGAPVCRFVAYVPAEPFVLNT